MNPFTRFLSRRMQQPDLAQFVERWDQLEALVIAVFKGGGVDDEAQAEYAGLRPWLVSHYPHWEAELAEYWPEAVVGGQPAPQDPFRRLLQAEEAADFVGDWEAMQYLPAAREALNRLVLAREG